MILNDNSKNNYFPALTGIRAIAAYMVFFHHQNPFSEAIFGRYIHDFFSELHVGVTLFFVLSGFLIAYRYFDEEKINFRKYLVNRFARIYPVYFLLSSFTFLVFAFVFHKGSLTENGINYVMNITFLKGLFDDLKFTGIAQGWSLTVEEMFYFTAPVSFLLIKKNKYALIFIPIFMLSLGAVLVCIFQNINFYGFFSSFRFMLSFTFLGRVVEFFIGIALALIVKKYQNKVQTKYCTLVGVIVIICSIFALSFLKGDNELGIRHPMGIFINNILLPLLGIAMLFWGLLVEKTFLRKILSSKLFVLLGKSSYVFYLIHLGVICALVSRVSHNVVFVFITLNVISILIFKFIEEPLNLFFRRLLNK